VDESGGSFLKSEIVLIVEGAFAYFILIGISQGIPVVIYNYEINVGG